MDVTDISAPSREGAYVNGLSLDGARWNLQVCVRWRMSCRVSSTVVARPPLRCSGTLFLSSNYGYNCFEHRKESTTTKPTSASIDLRVEYHKCVRSYFKITATRNVRVQSRNRRCPRALPNNDRTLEVNLSTGAGSKLKL